MPKKSDQHKKQVQQNYETLIKHKINSLYDDIRYEQDEFITFDNLHSLSTIAWYIEEFRKTNNPNYIDLMIILAFRSGFTITKSLKQALFEACICRINENDRGGIKEITRNNLKNQALQTMFNLIHFLEMSKKEASERAAFYIYRLTGEPKIKSTSLYKEFNSFIKNNNIVNSIKGYSEERTFETTKNWQDNIDHYPLPPDGHEVLGI